MVVLDGVEMLDVREAARLVRRTPETVRRWVWSGRIPARKTGNRLLLPRSDVLAVAGTTSSEPERSAVTLQAWKELAAGQARRGGRGGSARDLVLADRAGRGDAGARR